MTPETLSAVGAVLAAMLGSGTVTGVLGYVRDRRRDKGDVTLATFTNLKEMNALLTTQLTEVQTQLDNERNQRRGLEDVVAVERRERRGLEEQVAAERRARQALEERIVLLERGRPPMEEDS